jgi:carboxypeptidase family protein
MRKLRHSIFLIAFVISVLWLTPVHAQERKGTITVVSDTDGQFTIPDLAPGKYTLTVSYVGFDLFSTEATVPAGGVANVEAVLKLEAVNEQVIVKGERERGEVEAINREIRQLQRALQCAICAR